LFFLYPRSTPTVARSPPDFYLRLGGAATALLRGDLPASFTPLVTPSDAP
jgi:hypothetical protein